MVGSKLMLAGSLLLLALAPLGALAADIKMQSSTQYFLFSATEIDATGRFSTVGDVRVYFR